MCLCVYVIILVNGFAPRSAPRFAPFTPLTVPITILCQSTAPAFLQLGGKGLFTAIAVPTQAGLGFRCVRKTADVWGGIFSHCRGGEFRQKDQMTSQLLLLWEDILRIKWRDCERWERIGTQKCGFKVCLCSCCVRRGVPKDKFHSNQSDHDW